MGLISSTLYLKGKSVDVLCVVFLSSIPTSKCIWGIETNPVANMVRLFQFLVRDLLKIRSNRYMYTHEEGKIWPTFTWGYDNWLAFPKRIELHFPVGAADENSCDRKKKKQFLCVPNLIIEIISHECCLLEKLIFSCQSIDTNSNLIW